MKLVTDLVLPYSSLLLFLVVIILFWRTLIYIDSKKTADDAHFKQHVIEQVVQAVEQLYRGESGPAKLARAKDLSINILATYNLSLTAEELSVYIEAAVDKHKKENTDPLKEHFKRHVLPQRSETP